MLQENDLYNSASFRFYGSLNDFLPKKIRQRTILYHYKGKPSIKDAIEAIGIPHPEVQIILKDHEPSDFSSSLVNNSLISVFPFFSSLDIQSLQLANSHPYKHLRFILDVHLGKLAKFLRFAGLDSLIYPGLEDSEIADIGAREERILLTRDIGLLKHRKVQFGYWIRSQDPMEQFKEVALHFRISESDLKPLKRCSICNGKIMFVEKKQISEKLKPQTNKYYSEFFQCENCGHIYWKGSHYEKIQRWLNTTMSFISSELKGKSKNENICNW